MKNKRNVVGIIVLILALIGIAIFWYVSSIPEAKAPTDVERNSTSTTEPTSSYYDESSLYEIVGKLRISTNTVRQPGMFEVKDGLREISLCGGDYKVRKIFIDSIEIMPRIEKIFSKNQKQENAICNAWRHNAFNRGGQAPDGSELYMTVGGENGSYELDIALSIDPPKDDFPLFVDVKKNTITTIDGGIVGQFKEKESGV
jgi:hypothetical protein